MASRAGSRGGWRSRCMRLTPTEGRTKPFLSVAEAAELLGVSRTMAYELTNAWLATDGKTGIPCIRLGRRILVHRASLDEWATIGCSNTADTDQPSFT